MYYKEAIIAGRLCWKATPDGDWIPFTEEELTNRIIILEAKLKAALRQVDPYDDDA